MDAGGKLVGLIRIVRTFFLVCIGDLFFRSASVGDALAMLKGAVRVWNPHILWNGALLTLGLDGADMVIAAVALMLLLIVSLLERTGSVRDRVARMPLPVRWLIWYALLFAVILFGCYGPGYSAGEFIYQGF